MPRFWRRSGPAAILIYMCVTLASAVQTRERDPGWVAPPDVDAMLNPLADLPDLAAGGAKLFRQRCSSCHAHDGRGTPKAPALCDPAVQSQSDGAVFWKMTTGNTRAGMPAFSYLPEKQRWQLVLHVRALCRADRDSYRPF